MKRLRLQIEMELNQLLENQIMPGLLGAAEQDGLADVISVDLSRTVLRITYKSLTAGQSYLKPSVKLEYGASTSARPTQKMPIGSLIDQALGRKKEFDFQVLDLRRTLLEKLLAVHSANVSGKVRPFFSRHFFDIVALTPSIDLESLFQPEIFDDAAWVSDVFYATRSADGSRVSFRGLRPIDFLLLPGGETLQRLEQDFTQMVEAGYLYDSTLTWSGVLESLESIQNELRRMR